MPKYEIWFDRGEAKSREDLVSPDLTINTHDLGHAVSTAADENPYSRDESEVVLIIKQDQKWYYVQAERGWSVHAPASELTFDQVCEHFETDLYNG